MFGFGQEELQIFRSGTKFIEERISRGDPSLGGKDFHGLTPTGEWEPIHETTLT